MIWRDSLADLIAFEIGTQMNAMFDAGSTLELFTGSAPASIDDADSGTLIISLTLNDPPFVPSGSFPYKAEMDVTGMNGSNVGTGTIGYFRLKTNAGAVQCQGSCGPSGSDINFAPNAVVSGSRVITITQLDVLLDLVTFET